MSHAGRSVIALKRRQPARRLAVPLILEFNELCAAGLAKTDRNPRRIPVHRTISRWPDVQYPLVAFRSTVSASGGFWRRPDSSLPLTCTARPTSPLWADFAHQRSERCVHDQSAATYGASHPLQTGSAKRTRSTRPQMELPYGSAPVLRAGTRPPYGHAVRCADRVPLW